MRIPGSWLLLWWRSLRSRQELPDVGFGVFGSVFAAVVGFQALFQTVCPSSVKSTVGTLDDVGVIHGAPFGL